MAIKEQFVVPKKYNTFSLALMAIGLLSIIILYITNGSKSDELVQARFWASLLQNSVYFLLVVNAALFFIYIPHAIVSFRKWLSLEEFCV